MQSVAAPCGGARIVRRRRWSALFLALAVLLGVFAGVPAASAATGDVGYEGPSHSGTGTPTGTKRSESVLWFNDGKWWGNMWDTSTSDFYIFYLRTSDQTWIRTGTKVDTRSNTHADVLWDGSKLYIASHQFVNDGLPAVSGYPGKLYRYSYNTSTDTYTLDSGYPAQINNLKTETLTIDKDSTGTLWATWQQGNYIYVNHSVGGDPRNWSTPMKLPGAPAVSVDDTSSLIAYTGAVGVMWSSQSGAAPDGMYFSIHTDGAADTAWSPTPIVAFQAPKGSDDHMNLKWLDATTDKVYAAVKTSFTSGSQALIQLLVFNTGTGKFESPYMIARQDECPNRVILLIDEAKRLLRTFATYPSRDGVCSTSGGAIYEKDSPLDGPTSFPASKGNPVIMDYDSPYVHNVSSTKQNIKAGMGVVVLADNNTTSRYWHFYEAPGTTTPTDTTPPDTSITGGPSGTVTTTDASFTFTSTEANSTFECQLDAGAWGACTSPKAYTGLAAGSHTFNVQAKDAAGNIDTTPATQTWTIDTTAPPSGGTATLTAVEDTWVGSDATSATHGNDTALYSVTGTPTKITYLKFDLAGVSGTVTDAKLTVTTTSGSYSGSPSAQDVYPVSDTSWSEGSMTYANKPALGSKVASIAGGSKPSTAYTVVVPASVVQAAVGGKLTLAITAAAADAFYVNSSESTAAGKPQLAVTAG